MPSMKSMVEDPEISTSAVLFMVTLVRVKSPDPPASIPTLLSSMDMSLNDMSLLVPVPYLNAGPEEPSIEPVTSPVRSLR